MSAVCPDFVTQIEGAIREASGMVAVDYWGYHRGMMAQAPLRALLLPAATLAAMTAAEVESAIVSLHVGMWEHAPDDGPEPITTVLGFLGVSKWMP